MQLPPTHPPKNCQKTSRIAPLYFLLLCFYKLLSKFSFFFQSSLDRGCFSCECLIVPDSREGIRFWKRKLGTKKIEDILEEKKRKKEEEVILEISRAEMKILLDQQDDEESDMEQQHWSNETQFRIKKYSSMKSARSSVCLLFKPEDKTLSEGVNWYKRGKKTRAIKN